MMSLQITYAQAYVNFGRWVADCPLECGNALLVEPGQGSFFCQPPGGCGHIGTLVWDANYAEIWRALEERQMPKTRNWFPKDHPLALKAGCPSGQTVEELREEARVNGAI